MKLKAYLQHEVKQGFLAEKTARCIEYEATRALGLKASEASKLNIVMGVIFIDAGEREASVELGELLHKCGGRAGG